VVPSNEIEDLFASAVKSVFDPSAAPPGPAPAHNGPAAAEKPKQKRIRAWAVVLLCLALAVVTAVIAAVIFHVRRSDVAGMAARIHAEYLSVVPDLLRSISSGSK
jgi:type VI protein secretion system component VasF